MHKYNIWLRFQKTFKIVFDFCRFVTAFYSLAIKIELKIKVWSNAHIVSDIILNIYCDS